MAGDVRSGSFHCSWSSISVLQTLIHRIRRVMRKSPSHAPDACCLPCFLHAPGPRVSTHLLLLPPVLARYRTDLHERRTCLLPVSDLLDKTPRIPENPTFAHPTKKANLYLRLSTKRDMAEASRER